MFGSLIRDDLVIRLAREGLFSQAWSDVAEAVVLRETINDANFSKNLISTLEGTAERMLGTKAAAQARATK